MKWIDLPPVWLGAGFLAAWWIGRADPFGLTFGEGVVGDLTDLLAGLSIGAGLVLMILAVTEMRKWRTTVIPHREADHLVTTGIFRRSRNPIYLGDTLVLLGLILRFDAPLALPLLPLFVWVIERRFILPEERHLRAKFRQDFLRYTERTRRWL